MGKLQPDPNDASARRPTGRIIPRTPATRGSISEQSGRGSRGTEWLTISASQLRAVPPPAQAPEACEACHDAGWVRLDVPVGDPTFGKIVHCRSCDAYQRIVFAAVQHYTRVPADLAAMAADWTTFPLEMDAEAIVAMQRYSARICAGNIDGVRGIVLMGHNQVGKSGLVYCVHQDLLAAQIPSVFLTEIDLLELLTEAMFNKECPERHLDILDRLAMVTHLVLDDLGAAKPTDKREEFLFTLLDRRGKQPRTVTTITTNLDGPELQAHLGKRVYARIAGRAYSRLLVEGAYCALIGGDPDAPPASNGIERGLNGVSLQ